MENNTTDGFNNRMIVVKEQISELEDQVKELIQKVLGWSKKIKRMKEKLKDMKDRSVSIWWESQMQIRAK